MVSQSCFGTKSWLCCGASCQHVGCGVNALLGNFPFHGLILRSQFEAQGAHTEHLHNTSQMACTSCDQGLLVSVVIWRHKRAASSTMQHVCPVTRVYRSCGSDGMDLQHNGVFAISWLWLYSGML